MLTDEATRARLLEQGWRLVVPTPEYEDWRLLSDPQDTGITIVHWGPPMLTGNSALILKALACGVKVPGYVVVPEEVLTRGMSALKAINGTRWTSFGLCRFQDELAALTPPKEGT